MAMHSVVNKHAVASLEDSVEAAAVRRVPRGSTKWNCLKTLSVSCLLVSIADAAGSIADVIDAIKVYQQPFSR